MGRFMIPAYNPEPIQSPQNALMQGLEMQRAQQGNALQQMQMQDLHEQRQIAIQQAREAAAMRARQQNALMQMLSPQMEASQQALAGGGGPTMANAARMQQVDPRMQALHGLAQAGLVPVADYVKQRYPAPSIKTAAPGSTIYDERDPTKPLMTVPDKADKGTSDMQNYNAVKAQGYTGTLEQFLREQANLKAPKTSISVGAAESEFSKELAKLDAKQLDGYRDSADKAVGAVGRVRAMRDAVNGGIYSGSFAGDRAKLANFFATLGAPGVDLGKLANTQEYQKHAKELVLSVLKDGVGSTNISNADLAFVNDTVPQLETSPEARTRLLNYIERRSQSNIDKFQQADAYARKNRGLGGFAMNAPAQTQAPPSAPGAVRKFNPVTGRIE